MDANTSLGIAAVERETGISKETLRIWERRYAFPLPTRNEAGKRAYFAEDVTRLKLINRLLKKGHRPSKLVTLSMVELNELLANTAPYALPPGFELVVAWLKKADSVALKNWLITQIAREGLRPFLENTLGPMLVEIGEAWKNDRLRVHEEHLFSETVQQTLRLIINNLPVVSPRPHILLTTPEGELHGLGLLIVESILALEGMKVTSLGVNTPLGDIAVAAVELHVDIVILSMTANYKNAEDRNRIVSALRHQLNNNVDLFIGGSGLDGITKTENVLLLKSFDSLMTALAEKRAAD